MRRLKLCAVLCERDKLEAVCWKCVRGPRLVVMLGDRIQRVLGTRHVVLLCLRAAPGVC